MTAILRQVDRVVDGRTLARGLLVVAPLVVAALGTRDALWMNGAIVTASTFIAMERIGLAPLGVALHGLAISAGFLVLFMALPFPPLFALAAAAMASGASLLTAKGHRLRTLGNFTFIPALFLACELGRIGDGSALARGLTILPYATFAIIPVLVLSAAEHWPDRNPDVRSLKHLGRVWRRRVDFGAGVPFAADMISVALAVSVAALLVSWQHVSCAQWVVWSAASIVNGDPKSAWRKLGDRIVGVLVGAPVGAICAMFAPHAPWVLQLAGVAAVPTLWAFRIYWVGFGARCALIALGLTMAGQSGGAAERIGDVLLGGAVGLAFVLAVHMTAKLTRRLKPSIRLRLRRQHRRAPTEFEACVQ